MITQKARDVRTVEPLLHLPGGIGGIGHTRLEIVEEIAHQQQMIMRLSLDDSVSDPNPVMDAGRINQRIQAIVPRFALPMAQALFGGEASPPGSVF